MKVTLKGTIRCRKCGSLHTSQAELVRLNGDENVQTCANPDCGYVLVDMRREGSLDMGHFIAEGIEVKAE